MLASACATTRPHVADLPDAPTDLDRRVASVHDARTHGRSHEALQQLVELLDARDRDGGDLDPSLRAAIAHEVAWAEADTTLVVKRLVVRGRLSGAHAVVASRRTMLHHADFAALWPRLADAIATGATTRCDAITHESPYLARLTARYCDRLGIEAPALAPLPSAIAAITLTGDVKGVTPDQRSRLETAIAHQLEASPWYDHDAPRASASIAGAQRIEVAEPREERIDVPWVERIPYTETAVAVVPFSARHRFTPLVVAAKTKTKFREEAREYSYYATRREADYAARWRFHLVLAASSDPITFETKDRDHRVGYDHDVTYEPAGVSPSRANLPTDDEWFDHVLAGFEAALAAELSSQWSSTYCREHDYTLETAARCAYGATPPSAARAVLAESFGNELGFVLER